MKKIIKIVSIILVSIIGINGLGIGINYLTPISIFTPYWLILSKGNLNGVGDNILLGNKHIYFQSPYLTHIGTKAWSAEDQVYGLTKLNEEGNNNQIFYQSYSKEEIVLDKTKKDVSYYAFKNHDSNKKPFIITLAGGGFTSVCTMCESLPVSAKFAESDYPTFALTYRVGSTFGELENQDEVMDDIAASIKDIIARKDEFNIDENNYYIVGFSAGGELTSLWCDEDYGYNKYNLPRPQGCGLIYGFVKESIEKENYVPTFSLFCKNDPYFSLSEYEDINNSLENNQIKHYQKVVDCLHGFGLGTGSEAEGWTNDFLAFYNL